MTIKIYTIEKLKKDNFYDIILDYKKMISKFAKIEDRAIFSKDIAKAQSIGEAEAKRAYTKAFLPLLGDFNVALDVKGKELDSFQFSELFKDRASLSFFIGGAYGFEDEFLRKCDIKVSLSRLTMGHKIAKIVLFEQIYRAFTILNNHPYHK
ncbi:MAG: 23S rRNA (pseudouridine(1915)-N(3))-methyltransferase RlmH [Epsilonproteobacteria bacterium]|nr:23S rRNA (pseudouridine(1915)-N(3))-methyltransferase RlmH [Campylobacterota bacterium]